MSGVSVFFSYAQEDHLLVEELKKHLMVFKRQKLIDEWYDHSFLPGSVWTQEHEQHLETATLIALAISPDFINSDYCYSTEMRRAMERYTAGTAHVLPILLKPVLWEGTPFAILAPLPSNTKFVTTWPNQNEAFFNISQGFLQILKDLQSTDKPSSQASSQTAPSSQPIFMLPFRRDPFFTGRESILTQLRTLFLVNETVALTQPPALSGLGGIGKTQTAIEYAYRYQEHYKNIFWIRSATQSEIISDLLKISDLLNLPEKQATDQELIIAAVKRWLEQNPAWLLIFDNADDLDMVAPYLPARSQGHLLFTTRSQHPGALARPIDLEQMILEEGALLLLRRARLLDPIAPLQQARSEDLTLAQQLVNELGGLPLALNQAGAYIEETKCNLTRYLSLYRTQRQKLLQHRGQQASLYGHADPVATTWDLSFKIIENKNPAAAELLRLCAFLAPDAIPEELFSKGAEHLGPILEPIAKDPFAFELALSGLLSYSLLRRNPEAQTLTIHRLVQAVLQDQMPEQTQQLWIERTIKIVNATFPGPAFEYWEQCERLLPQIQNCLVLIDVHVLSLEAVEMEMARLLNEFGLYMNDHYGLFQISEKMYQKAYELYLHKLGQDHPNTQTTLNNLAGVYYAQGRYEGAEALYEQVRQVRERVLGQEHPNTQKTLNNLAVVYRNQGRYEEAEKLHEQIWQVRERVLGQEHLDTQTTLNNLAAVFRDQGRYEEAEKLHEQVRQVQERILGPLHPSLGVCLYNLAEIYYVQGKYEEAEKLYLRVVAIDEHVYGPDHRELITDLKALVTVYQAQGKQEQAAALLQRIKSIQNQL